MRGRSLIGVVAGALAACGSPSDEGAVPRRDGLQAIRRVKPGLLLAPSGPETMTSFASYAWGSRHFMLLGTRTNGCEPWVSDGTDAGTRMIADLVPGPASSCPSNLSTWPPVEVDGTLYFPAAGPHGDELWRTDGTAEGTVRLTDVSPGVGDGLRGRPVVFDGAIYFNGSPDPSTGELYRFIPADGGLEQLTQGNANPQFLTRYAGGLYFSISPFGSVGGLYRYDGSGAPAKVGTVGATNSWVSDLVPLGGTLYLLGPDSSTNYGNALWKSDGVTTTLVADIDDGGASGQAYLSELTAAGSTLYFVTNYLAELWKSDGTEAGTVPVRRLRPDAGFIVSGQRFQLTAVGDRVFFAVNDLVIGSELWVSDGTEAGTNPVADLRPGAQGSTPRSLTPFGDRLLFGANSGSGERIYITDGTATGTTPLSPAGKLSGATPAFSIVGGEVLFELNDGVWRTDGTLAGTRKVSAGPSAANPSVETQLVAFDGGVLFVGGGATEGFALWRSDGTTEGTSLVRDVTPGVGPSTLNHLTPAGPFAYFTALSSGVGHSALWRTDGTMAGTLPVVSDVGIAIGEHYAASGPDFYFEAAPDAGPVLFRYDGTGSTLVRLMTLPTSVNELVPDPRGGVFFLIQDNTFGTVRLWHSNGTASGTRLVTSNLIEAVALTTVTDRAALIARLSTGGEPGVWVSDGTDAGTRMIGPGSSAVAQSGDRLGSTGQRLLLVSTASPGGQSLLSYEPSGMMQSVPLAPPGQTGRSHFERDEGRAFFITGDAQRGRSLWMSDGTAAGTRPLLATPCEYEVLDTTRRSWVSFGGEAIFPGGTHAIGCEPFAGSLESGVAAAAVDLNPGPGSSNPEAFTPVGGLLFFSAWDGTEQGLYVTGSGAGGAGGGGGSAATAGGCHCEAGGGELLLLALLLLRSARR